MSDRDDEFVAVWRVSTAWVVLLGIVVLPLSVLLVGPVFSESGQAGATVGYVLAEALLLYVVVGGVAAFFGFACFDPLPRRQTYYLRCPFPTTTLGSSPVIRIAS